MRRAIAAAFVVVALALVASACDSDAAEPGPPDGVTIESIEPESGSALTVVVLRGTGFVADNDVGFRHADIGEQWDSTGWLNGVASEDGTTLRFTLPDSYNTPLAACAYSQLGPNEACPDIGLPLPPGEVQIVVANEYGVSNAVAFAFLGTPVP